MTPTLIPTPAAASAKLAALLAEGASPASLAAASAALKLALVLGPAPKKVWLS